MTKPDAPLRVLQLIARLNVGGPAQHVVWLNCDLRHEGLQPMLVTGMVPPGEHDMSAFAAERGVTPVILSSMSRDLSYRDLTTIWQLWRLMVSFRPDIVHTHTAKAGAVGRIAGLFYRFLTPGTLIGRPRVCRFVHTYHGHVFHSYYGRAGTRLFLMIERALAWLNTDRLIVLSSQQLLEIRDTFRVGAAAQFAVVPLGLDLERLRQDATPAHSLREELGIGADETIVAIVGRVTAIKNHELFLRVAQRSHSGARFVVFGDGEARAGIERAARASLTPDRVIFGGTRDAAEIYASLDVAILTSRNEGTPLALIEAMACGKPVISTAVGGVVDLLGPVEEVVRTTDGAYEIRARGITAAAGDEAGLTAGLDRLLSDEALRSRFCALAKAYVERTHSKLGLVTDIIALYHDMRT